MSGDKAQPVDERKAYGAWRISQPFRPDLATWRAWQARSMYSPAPRPPAGQSTAFRYRAEQVAKDMQPVYEAFCVEQGAELRADVSGVHMVVAGALFDFAGWLTSRREVIEVGASRDASPVANAIAAFAKSRGLILDNAAVLSWQEAIAAGHGGAI